MRRALLGSLLLGACLVPREPNGRPDETCTSCHGDATRAGDAVSRSAPPKDIRGNTGVEFPGVGAHALHLASGVQCSGCHLVPATLGAPGHNDGVTQVVFDGGGAWDLGSRTCSNTACHRAESGVWTRPRADACGTCHGLPPPAPHPQATACGTCHLPVDGGAHVNGVVDLQVAVSCGACHGVDATGAPDSGAHATHLAAGVACATCHDVPASIASHPNGQLEVRCGGACHFGAPPPWTSTQDLTCSGCHGAPPPAPHPQAPQCSMCHAFSPATHVNGAVDVAVPASCDGCHGSAANPAPPRDLDGGVETSRPGVGAHQVHLVPNPRTRTVECSECHVVPAAVLAAGHVDGVTQVRFSGVAVANLAMPRYTGGTCAGTACHDVAHFTVQPGGGTTTAPEWTRVDGGQVTCTSCHGQPPPPPHPVRTDCGACHPGVGATHVNGRVDFVP